MPMVIQIRSLRASGILSISEIIYHVKNFFYGVEGSDLSSGICILCISHIAGAIHAWTFLC